MGNALRLLYGHCCKPTAADDHFSGHHGVSAGVSALAHDLYQFEISSQVCSNSCSDFSYFFPAQFEISEIILAKNYLDLCIDGELVM